MTVALLTEEQTMLRDAAREWTAEKSPVSALRKVRDSKAALGYDAALWAEMGEMGWAGVVVPEAYGGSEFGYLGLGLILEETGKTLTASPLLSTALAGASALVLGASEAQKAEWLPKIATGEVVVSLAIDEGAHHAPEKTALTAGKSSDGHTLTGAKTFVIEGMAADLFVVAARTAGKPGDTAGVVLFLVPANAKGVSRSALHLADSRGHATVRFDNVEVPADNLLAGGWGTVEGVLDRVRAGLAAEMLGASVQAFQITLEYLPPIRPADWLLPEPAASRGQDVRRDRTDPLGGGSRLGRHRR
jgi:alkylation response protein AidB-like acyl-CoA dehydrogenase